jgi:hypothetical protein
MLRIFIALKNPSPWLGSNSQPFGPKTSTLITTPPRRHYMVNQVLCLLEDGVELLKYFIELIKS